MKIQEIRGFDTTATIFCLFRIILDLVIKINLIVVKISLKFKRN